MSLPTMLPLSMCVCVCQSQKERRDSVITVCIHTNHACKILHMCDLVEITCDVFVAGCLSVELILQLLTFS